MGSREEMKRRGVREEIRKTGGDETKRNVKVKNAEKKSK